MLWMFSNTFCFLRGVVDAELLIFLRGEEPAETVIIRGFTLLAGVLEAEALFC